MEDVYERTALDYAMNYGKDSEIALLLDTVTKEEGLGGRMRRSLNRGRVRIALELAAENKAQILGRHGGNYDGSWQHRQCHGSLADP